MSDTIQMGQDIPIMTVNTDFQGHNWVQHGRELVCGGGCSMVTGSNISQHGTRLKNGVMLVGSRGNWSLEMQRGNVKDVTEYSTARRLAENKRKALETAK